LKRGGDEVDTEKRVLICLGEGSWCCAEDFPSLLMVNQGLITMLGYRCIGHFPRGS